MTLKPLPVLCAALMLAACQGGTTESDTTLPASESMAGLPGGTDGMTTGPASSPVGGVVAGSLGDFEQSVGNTVRFETDSYSLTADAQAVLQKQAKWLQAYPQHMVTIEGHADERGTREYNLALGDRRAQTVMNYLAALGVDSARLKEVSYGKEKPVCPDATDACWSENRRSVTALDN